MILPSIETPADLKGLNEEQLAELCEEIRIFIVDTVTTTGGHLGSNLGAVELTLALHRVERILLLEHGDLLTRELKTSGGPEITVMRGR